MSEFSAIASLAPGDNSPIVDITNTKIGFNVIYTPDDDPTKPQSVVAVEATPASNILGQVMATTPLGMAPALLTLENAPGFFQQLWESFLNGDPANHVQSLQARVTAILDGALGKGNYSASPVSVPPGRVRARVIPYGTVGLDFWISPITLDLHITMDGFGLDLQATVDSEIFVVTYLQWPYVKMFSQAGLANAHIGPQPGSSTAQWWDEIKLTHDSVAQDKPFDTQIGLYEDLILTSVVIPAPDVSGLATAFSNLGQACLPLGLMQCVPRTDGKSLAFDLVHPVDPAPVAFDPQKMAAPNFPLLTSAVLATPSQAIPGSQVSVTGSGFPPSTVLRVAWTDTCSGQVRRSVVQWQTGGKTYASSVDRIITINGKTYYPAPIFTLPTTAQATQQFQVHVRDSDLLTTTPLSNAVTLQSLGEVVLVLAYQSTGKHQPPLPPTAPGPASSNAGTVSVSPDGTFSGSIIIPDDAKAGTTATLYAQASGVSIASALINIVAKRLPVIWLVDPATDAYQLPSVNRGYSVKVMGEALVPTMKITFAIDTADANPLGETETDSSGGFVCSFFWPLDLLEGPHTLLVLTADLWGVGAVQASLVVTEENPLQ